MQGILMSDCRTECDGGWWGRVTKQPVLALRSANVHIVQPFRNLWNKSSHESCMRKLLENTFQTTKKWFNRIIDCLIKIHQGIKGYYYFKGMQGEYGVRMV